MYFIEHVYWMNDALWKSYIAGLWCLIGSKPSLRDYELMSLILQAAVSVFLLFVLFLNFYLYGLFPFISWKRHVPLTGSHHAVTSPQPAPNHPSLQPSSHAGSQHACGHNWYVQGDLGSEPRAFDRQQIWLCLYPNLLLVFTRDFTFLLKLYLPLIQLIAIFH